MTTNEAEETIARLAAYEQAHGYVVACTTIRREPGYILRPGQCCDSVAVDDVIIPALVILGPATRAEVVEIAREVYGLPENEINPDWHFYKARSLD